MEVSDQEEDKHDEALINGFMLFVNLINGIQNYKPDSIVIWFGWVSREYKTTLQAMVAVLSQYTNTGLVLSFLNPMYSINLLSHIAYCTAEVHATNLASIGCRAIHVCLLLLQHMAPLFSKKVYPKVDLRSTSMIDFIEEMFDLIDPFLEEDIDSIRNCCAEFICELLQE